MTKVVFVVDEIPRSRVAGYLSLNLAVIEAMLERGWEVGVAVVGARARYPVLATPKPLQKANAVIFYRTMFQTKSWAVARPVLLRAFMKRVVSSFSSFLADRIQKRARPSGRSRQAVIGRWVTDKEVRWAQSIISSAAPDIVIADTFFRVPCFPTATKGRIARGVVAHDVFHERVQSLRTNGFNVVPDGITQEAEVAALNLADVVGAVNEIDCRTLAALIPDRKIVLASMPMDPVPRHAEQDPVDGRLIFVGSRTPHNSAGIRWFLKDVMPLILADCPSATVEIVGGVGRDVEVPPALRSSVILSGVVPDMSRNLHSAQVGVVPMLVGSGLKIKALDYLRHGLPVVATEIGAAGLFDYKDPPVLTAHSASEFAAHVLALISLRLDEAQSLEFRALEAAAQAGTDFAVGTFLDSLEALTR